MSKQVGGFEHMNLLPELYRAIRKKGYNLPTPIQRKAIPPAQAGHDVIAIGRTGSGKSAAFLIPLINSLREHSTTVGARGLILSPTRDLAQQTLRFSLDLAKFTSLKVCALIGGEGLKQEFSKLAENPDIIVATPGRMLHYILELNYTLESIEIIVLDEVDKLIEMGLMDQVKSVLQACSKENKQTLCFSATLPDVLSEFSKTGLSNPLLIKLDQEFKIPKELELDFFLVREEDRLAGLLMILRLVEWKKQTIVFVATRYHVEYLEFMLQSLGFSVIGIFGSMDEETRRKGLNLFRRKKRSILITTDVSARGLDIPMLDNVIHYNFPDNPKLFIHRSGRVARAGRLGHCYSLVSHFETPYLIDIFTHLGLFHIQNIGSVDEEVIRTYSEELKMHLVQINESEMQAKLKSVNNALKAYNKTRQSASKESVRRMKEMKWGIHPMFNTQRNENLEDFLSKIKSFRPASNVIELNAKLSNNTELLRKVSDWKKEKPEKKREDVPKSEPVLPKKTTKNAHFIEYGGQRTFEKDNDFTQISMEFPVDDELTKNKKNKMVWDNKKKRYVQQNNKKLFLVNDTAKKLYKEWSKQSKQRIQKTGEVEDPNNISKRVGTSKKPKELRKQTKKKNKFKKHKKVKRKK